MKKYFISALACAVALVSCVKENNAPEQIPGKGQKITISATIPADGLTKVAFAEDGVDYAAGLKLTWEEGDAIFVIDAANSGNFSVFELTGGKGTATGVFSGDALTGAESYIIQYSNEPKGFNCSEQTQATDGSTSHLKYSACLNGVSEYESFTFSEAWATSKGGTFQSSSVLRVRADIPMDIDKVQAVYIKVDEPVFDGKKEIKVNITNPADAGEPDVLTVYASLPMGMLNNIPNTGLVVQFQVSDKAYDKFTAYRPFSKIDFKAGQVNSIAIDCNTDQDITLYANQSAEGIGTAANPYLIGDQHQMVALHNFLVAEQTTYIKIVDDIDMTGVDWEPLNYADPYKKFVNFDGHNCTISNLTVGKGGASYGYPSLFGVLYGECKDLVIDNADISVKSNYKSGIIAGYLGTSSSLSTCVLSNITIKNSSIGSASGNTSTRTMGALAGQAAMPTITITNCHVSNTTVTQLGTATCHVGGFLGYSQYAVSVTDCSTDATVTGTQFAGGFVGYGGQGTFTNCLASGTVSGVKDVGGFVGKTEDPTFINCGYTGTSVSASDNSKNAHPGGFVGYANKNGSSNVGGSFTSCYVDGSAVNAASGQRVGGFAGQADAGNTFTECYAKDVTLQGGLNSGGFVGVTYTGETTEVPGGGIFKCYVDGGTLTANGNNCGGFVGYPENARIQNSYSSMAVVGGDKTQIGGFIGNCRGGNSVTNCFESGTVSGTSATVGAFIGELTVDGPTVTKCIAWNGTLAFMGSDGGKDVSKITDNYCGNEGTISAQATTLGWDTNVWDLNGPVPTFKVAIQFGL